MKPLAPFVVTLALAISAVAQDYRTAVVYNETNLRPGGSLLNNSGQVVGTKSYPDGSHPFFWSKPTKLVDVGILGGIYNYGDGINDAGQVIADMDLPDQISHHAFFWGQSTGLQDVGTFGGTQSYPSGFNSSGQVVGWANLSGDLTGRAFLWTQLGGLQDIGAGDNSTAIAINASGQVLGASLDSQKNYFAFLWSQSSGLQLFQVPGATNTYLAGLSDSGQVVGNIYSSQCPLTEEGGCAFVWTPGTGFQYPMLNGAPIHAISENALGAIVGIAGSDPNTGHAVLWTPNGGAHDLGVLPGKSFSYPYALNNKGEVLGISCVNFTTCKSFVWRPGQGMRAIPHTNQFKIFTQINDAGQIVGIVNYNQTVLLSPWVHVKLASSQNPSKLGQSVTFTAAASSVEGVPKDGELVTFKVGNRVLGSVPLVAGVATFTASSFAVGTHAVTATYAGDVNYDAQKSGALQQVVTP